MLADPDRAAAKLASKARSVRETLGEDVVAPVHIDYVEDMGEWKTAWNQVRFTGFLGTPMTMQITWQGCDSTLAAPLVIDLARLTARARSVGRVGALDELGFFFKDPLGSDEHRLDRQFRRLVAWAQGLRDLAPVVAVPSTVRPGRSKVARRMDAVAGLGAPVRVDGVAGRGEGTGWVGAPVTSLDARGIGEA